MALKGRQVRQLRSLAHHLEPVIIIGKADVNEGTVDQADKALEARELIKCAVQQGCELTAREALDELCGRVHAEPVQCIGRRFVMYRRSRENHKIEL